MNIVEMPKRAAEFKVGDQVQLKSGGPPMTVFLVQDNMAGCHWFFEFEGELHHAAFDMRELIPEAV